MARGTGDLLSSFSDYSNHGLLPADGTMDSQSIWWRRAVSMLASERSKIEEAARILAAAGRG